MFKARSSGTYPYNRAKWDGGDYLLLWKAPWYWPFKRCEEGKSYKLPLAEILSMDFVTFHVTLKDINYDNKRKRAGVRFKTPGIISGFLSACADLFSPIEISKSQYTPVEEAPPEPVCTYMLRMDGSRLYLKGLMADFHAMDHYRRSTANLLAERGAPYRHHYDGVYTPYNWL